MKLLFSLLLLLITSCTSSDNTKGQGKCEVTTLEGLSMTMPYKIEIGKKLKPAEEKQAQLIIDAVFKEIDLIYNKWNPSSEISCLNRLQAFEKKLLSPELASFLKRCSEFVRASQGCFDPTVEPLQELWKTCLAQNVQPSEKELEKLRPAIGWDKIVLESNIFYKKDSRTALDLGGIVKGYAVDLLIERLKASGLKNVFVEWGGEVRATGKHPQGRNWAVYISNLEDLDPQHALAFIPLQDESIATSGDYMQQWTITLPNSAKKTFFHVFHPKTLRPLQVTTQSIASASVLAEDCTTADALATMLLMCETMEEAKNVATRLKKFYPKTSFWLMSRKEVS